MPNSTLFSIYAWFSAMRSATWTGWTGSPSKYRNIIECDADTQVGRMVRPDRYAKLKVVIPSDVEVANHTANDDKVANLVHRKLRSIQGYQGYQSPVYRM